MKIKIPSIADLGYTVIARTYGAIDPSVPVTQGHPADMEDGVELRVVQDDYTSPRTRQ